MALANMFRKHIGQFDIMQECGSTLTLQVYQQSNMLILIDENEKSKEAATTPHCRIKCAGCGTNKLNGGKCDALCQNMV